MKKTILFIGTILFIFLIGMQSIQAQTTCFDIAPADAEAFAGSGASLTPRFIGQTFTACEDGIITEASLYVFSTSTATDVELHIYNGTGVAGTLLYSGTPINPTVTQFVTETNTGVTVVSGQTYTLALVSPGATGSINGRVDTDNAYLGGGSFGSGFGTPSATSDLVGSLTITALPSPGNVSGSLALWLKADAGGAAWTDQSGNNTTITAVGGPTLNANSLNFNNQVTFNGSTDYYDLTNAVFANGTGDKSIYAVASRTANDDAEYIISLGNTGAGQGVGFGHWTSFPDSPFTSSSSLEITSSDTSWGVAETAVVGHSYIGGVDALYTNGSSIAINGDDYNLNLINGTTGKIGAFLTPAALSNWGGEIAEVIVYNSGNDTGGERQKIESYLAIKYGITLDPSIGAYVNSNGDNIWNTLTNAPYNNDIFGIARDDASGLDQQISKSVNTGAILTLSTDTNFTNANGTHASLTDGQFLMAGNNGGSTGNQITELPTGLTNTYGARIGREWKLVNTGAVASVNLQFDSFDDTYEVLLDDDGDFSNGGTSSLGALNASGQLLGETGLTGTSYITLARTVTPFNCDGTLYQVYLNGGNYELVTIDPITGNFSTGVNLTALGLPGNGAWAYNPVDNLAYYVHSASPYELYQLDATNKLTFLGNITGGLSGDINAGAMATDGTFYVMSATNQNVYSIALSTKTASLVVTVPATSNSLADIGVNPVDGNLYGRRAPNGQLVQITPAGVVTNIGTPQTAFLGTGAVYFTAAGEMIGYADNPSTGIVNSQETVIKVDITDGTVTPIATGPSTIGNDGFSCAFSLVLEKRLVQPASSPGAVNTYTFTFTNQSGGALTNVNFADALNAGYLWASEPTNLTGGITLGATSINGTANGNFTITSLPVGESSFDIDLQVPATAVLGSTFDNQATLTGLPSGISATVVSDDPNTAVVEDATTLNIIASPGNVSQNLALWLKADAGVTGAATVTQWSDQSGNGFDLSDNGTGSEPDATANVLNFNPTVTFDGTDDALINTLATEKITNNAVYIVARSNGSGAQSLFSSASNTVGDNLGERTFQIDRGGASNGYRFNQQPDTDYGFSTSDLVILTSNISGALGTASGLSTFANGTAGGTATLELNGGRRFTDYLLGANRTSTDFIAADIAEVIVYDINHTTERQQIESYLAIKYGITLNAGATAYKSSDGADFWTVDPTYNQDIFGIGRDDASALGQVQSKSVNANGIVTILAEAEGTNAANTFVDIADKEFLMVSSDTGAATWNVTGAPAGITKLSRTWRVQETGDVGTTQLDFDVADTNFDVPNLVSGTSYLFLYDSDDDDDLSDETPVTMTNPSGDIWRVAGINFTTGMEFTIASGNGFDISGIVYYDEDGEGDLDAGETTRLQDVTITLYNDVDNSDDFSTGDTVVGSATSSAASTGAYTFATVVPGEYVIVIDHSDTALNNDANNGNITYGSTTAKEIAVTVSNAAITDRNFGFDQAEVSLAVDEATINESGTAPTIATFTATIAPTTGFATTVNLAFSGTATGSGTDYTASGSSISIAADGTSGTVTATVAADTEVEVNETIIVDIDTVTNAVEQAIQQVTTTIADDDSGALTISIAQTTDGAESATPTNAQFTVSLDGGATNNTGSPITGTIALTGTATAGSDYTNVTAFSIANGDSDVVVDIPILDDNDVEVTETIIATISAPNVGAVSATDNATANITDDDSGSLSISIGSPVDGTEGTSDITFTVSIDGGASNGTGAAITGTVALTGTATNGTDYTDVTTFSIADGASSGTITVTVTDDSDVEVSETVIATISAPSVGAVSATDNATANILDDDAGALTISIGSPVDGTEGTSDITFTVSMDGSLTNGTGSEITGTVALTGTATNGTDYTDVTTFSIADGASSGTVTVAVTDDSEIEVNETVIATISSPSIGAVSATDSATANILDDDSGSLTISIAKTTDGAESATPTNAQFTISLDGGVTNNTGAAITGTLALTGTATGGNDYTDVTTFSIADGMGSVVVDIPILNDSEVEITETVIATISAPSTGAVSATDNASADITDDDSTALTLSIGSPVDGTEGTSDVTFTVSLDGSLSNGTGAAITGTVALTGTATNGTDYTDVTTFSIADGASSGTITVTVTDDSDVEISETVIATISAPSVGAVSATDNATANILDDDAAALTLSIGNPVDGTEGTSDVTFTVSLDGGLTNNTGAAITGTVALTGTATNGTDYTDVTTFSIADGTSSGTVTVSVTDDTDIEVTETVIATISAPSSGTIGTAAATANINDDDVGALTLSIGSPVDGTEGTSDVTFTVSLDGGASNGTGSAITGTVALTGTATNGTDYTDITTFSIADGASSGTITIAVTDDSDVEVSETLIATISAPSVGTVSATDNATANILDDDAAALTLSIGTPVDGTEGTSDVTFTVSLDGGAANGTGAAITGTVALTGTATNGTDYTDVTTFSIADGASSGTITVTVTDDSDVEVSETVIATISAPSVGTVSATDNATANIIDDDAAALTLSIGTPVDGTEGTSDVTFTVSLDGGATNGTGSAITGTVALTGTATNGTDYTDVTTFSIADGASSGTVIVTVTDDSDVEVSETVIATISAPSTGTIGTAMATANILDDDAGALTLSIGSPVDGTEGTSDVTFTVSLDGGLTNNTGAAITGTVALTGTATNGTDYTDVTTFSIADGASSGTVTVTVTDDSDVEVSETVIATISAPSVGTVSATDNATANILDDDAGTLTLSIGSPVDGTEGTSDVTFTVSLDGGLTNNTGAAITGTVALTGTATNGTDYTDVTTFSIADGASSGTITVTVTDDSDVEISETVIATISAPSTGTIGTAMATANIIDDDAGALTLSIGSPVDGTEGTSDVTFTVSLDGGATNGTGSAITGTVALTGTATNGTDYTDVTTFSIADGASSGTVTVTVTDDSDVEVSETVIATISAPSVGTVSATDNATANIIDNDVCNEPISLAVSDIQIMSVDLAWATPTGGTVTGYEWVIMASGDDPNTGTPIVSGSTTAPTVTVDDAGALVKNTNYDFYVRSVCSAIAKSAYAGPMAFTTLPDNDDDGIPDGTDPDDDNDGQSDVDETACGSDPLDSASTSPDNDGDNLPNCTDPDDDNDGDPDVTDPDDDNDGQSDVDEIACGSDPNDSTSISPDNEGDNIPDCVDPDDDNDGQSDDDETACGSDPLDSASTSPDNDSDNLPNCTDPDDDNDGDPDVTDPDDDNDGQLDVYELGCGSDPNDSNSTSLDTDGDNIPDCIDDDDDGDGQLDADEIACGSDPLDETSVSADNDGDNLPNCTDPDDDNDGTQDTLDEDDDNDGQSDADELACGTDPNDDTDFALDTDGDNIPDCVDEDDDGDGQSDADEIACGSDPLDETSLSDDADGDNLPNCSDPDDDNDGIADVLDDDDDNDGQSDEDEIACGSDPLDPQSKALDSDGDNIPDCTDEDDDGDGQSDADEIACGSDPLDGAAISSDNDLDGMPDCADPDDDNDGTPDVEDTDDDNDGISDADEVTCGSDPNDSTDAALDTDGDGIPDCVDEDDDGDGTPDEEDAFPLDETEDTDTDGDGEGDNADEDADNDGILDEDDLEPTLPYDPNADDDMDGFPNSVEDLNGDGNPYNDDSNGDGMADFLDPYDAGADDDNDGIPNGVENENKDSNPFNNDCDSDGTPDFLDADPCGITSAGAFTPNGDGINDTWVIQDIESYPFNTVKVYSRYGHEVFGARSYQNDWLGGYQDSSDKLPAGSYYYQINLGDGSPPIDGWLFINY